MSTNRLISYVVILAFGIVLGDTISLRGRSTSVDRIQEIKIVRPDPTSETGKRHHLLTVFRIHGEMPSPGSRLEGSPPMWTVIVRSGSGDEKVCFASESD